MDGGGESPVILFVCLLPKSFPPRLQLTRETFFNSVQGSDACVGRNGTLIQVSKL